MKMGKYTNAEAVAAVEATGLALASGKNIKLIANLIADQTWSGITVVLQAGVNLVFGEAVYIKNDNKMWKAKATAVATMPCMALAVGTIAANTEGEFLLSGPIRNDAWTWTPGGLLYVSKTTAGVLTHTKPSGTTDHAQVVGKAFKAGVVVFKPGECLPNSPTFKRVNVGDIVFKNGYYFTEIVNGIALLDKKSNIIRRWTSV